MAKIMNCPNMNRLADAIARCKGDVFLNLPDETSFNLKQNREALQLLCYLQPARDALDLDLTDKSDLPILIDYMLDAALC